MTVPCCYSDVNGTACTCRARKAAEADRDRIAREWSEVSQSNYQRAKAAEAALATARADAMREAANAIIPPAHCTAAHGQYWQGVHAARDAILALIPQEPKP